MLAFLVIGQIVSSNYVSGKNEGRSVEWKEVHMSIWNEVLRKLKTCFIYVRST